LYVLSPALSIYHLQWAASNSLLAYCMIEWGCVNYIPWLGPGETHNFTIPTICIKPNTCILNGVAFFEMSDFPLYSI
jgi:hypothetical protein